LDKGMHAARTTTRFERHEENISERSPPSLLQESSQMHSSHQSEVSERMSPSRTSRNRIDHDVTAASDRFLSLSSIREEREGHREDELVSEERGGAGEGRESSRPAAHGASGSRQLSERKQAWSQEILLPPQPRDQDEIDKSRSWRMQLKSILSSSSSPCAPTDASIGSAALPRAPNVTEPLMGSEAKQSRAQEPSRSERGEEEATESDSVEERRLQKFLALRRRREEDAQMRKQSSMTNSSGPSVSKRTVTPAGASASRHSNKKIIRNAIAHVCLVAVVEHKKRDAVLGLLDSCGSETANFCILLVRDPNLRYRGLYSVDLVESRAQLLSGTGPKFVTVDMIREFLKYDSGTKSFRVLETRDFSSSVDGVVLHPMTYKSVKI